MNNIDMIKQTATLLLIIVVTTTTTLGLAWLFSAVGKII